MTDDTDTLTEAQIREIARDEAREVAELEISDSDGEQWSLTRFIETFDLSRRQALQAMGLVALGYSGAAAVRRLAIGEAEAATTDDLTVPGELTTSTVTVTSDIDYDSQRTTNVGTSGKDIIDLNTSAKVNIVTVCGIATNQVFVENVYTYDINGSIEIVGTNGVEKNGPDGRNYTINSGSLSLKMDSGAYDVNAFLVYLS